MGGFKVMLAHKYTPDILLEDFYITPKLDGIRCVLLKDNDEVKLYSRQGKIIEGLQEIEEEAKKLPNGIMLDGELLVDNSGGLDSKALFKKTIKLVRKKGIKTGVTFTTFDYTPLNDFLSGVCHINASTRFTKMCTLLRNTKTIKPITRLYIGSDLSYINFYLERAIKYKQEGIMINLSNAPYECKRSKNVLKVKVFKEADVRVIDVIEGQGKYEGVLGSVKIQFYHKEKLHVCFCGSGFTDKERSYFWLNKNKLLNKIITVRYFEITHNDKGAYGLRFPTWVGLREDKNDISMY